MFMPFVHIPATRVDVKIGNEGMSLYDYGIPGRVVYTPGHSSGSISVLLESGEAFVGDLAMNKLPLRATPGLPIFAMAATYDPFLYLWRNCIPRLMQVRKE